MLANTIAPFVSIRFVCLTCLTCFAAMTALRDGDVAAQNGHLELLKSGQAKEFSTQAMDLAATNGHLEVVKWLHENREEGCT